MKILIKFLPFLIIAAAIIPAILPLFQPGFFAMHDDEQIGRLFDLHASLTAFHIPPRIVPNLGFGYGYPFFNFYPPFAYYIGEVFHLIGFGYIVSTKLMLVTVFLLSGWFMYIFTREFAGRLGGIVAAVAYTYASYRAVDVYVRGAFAEASSFIFIPLIFWAAYKIYQRKSAWYILILSIGFGALILSHNLIALMTIPFLGVWFLYLLSKSNQKFLFSKMAASGIFLGFGLTAYFWLPSYFERDYTLINILTSELANYSLHFVCTYQLWDSPWGYGGSIQGCFDGISFEIGKVQLIASFIAFILSLVYFVQKKKSVKIIPAIIFSFFLALCIFLMTKFSKPIWDFIPPLWYIQFPWRFLLISSFISAFLTGILVSFIKNQYLRIALSGILIVLIIFLSVDKFKPGRYINNTDEYYTRINTIRWDTSSLAYEYVPKGIQTYISDIGTTKINILEHEIATSASEIISGEMDVITLVNKPHVKLYDVEVETPGIFQINTFSFPGWRVYVNKEEVKYTDANKFKLIRVDLPVGNHLVEARFEDTVVRLVGNIITGISIIVIVTILVKRIFVKQKIRKKK